VWLKVDTNNFVCIVRPVEIVTLTPKFLSGLSEPQHKEQRAR
jgi:hypothetical protein